MTSGSWSLGPEADLAIPKVRVVGVATCIELLPVRLRADVFFLM